MQLTDIESLLQFAMKKEREAADFYRLCGDKATRPEMKAVFEKMADQESEHYHKIQHLTSNAIAAGLIKTSVDMKLSDYLADMDFRPGMAYHGLLVLAMKREEKAYRMYVDLAEKTNRPEMAKLFQMLANEELNHKQYIEKEYDDQVLREN